ncbi:MULTISPECIES: MaoC family dehydratase [Geobacter]|uniref:Enoyl-CoA hydratase n=2 Tax=Geobacter TaxID=28231 RepID=A0A0C1R095_9BACT|nr:MULTISPECIES: MaoC family dehydratase [Geobacter]AJY69969.1 enoyl-CoA hydratase [Geobacter sulfurreducens]ANA39184.1 enoyl-CoA hydratase [Geobacter anodireducens]KIE43906.1 enoyl-CoA hydratase [Geobacter soli]MBE2886611.1 MaoC family dehydratase [Geobacter anodireducens]HMN01238.1 MaoC family dehydratase [Geobacter anodireducens]
MSAADDLIAFLAPKLGTETHVGPWLTIDQERIDRFAHVTGDIQWIHTDPERARRESPYGATVAHGFLTLSLLPCLTEANHPDFFQRNYPGMRLRVNYGLNRVRFPQPVVVGSRLRARTLLKAVEPLAGAVQITYEITVEIEGKDKPACVAEQVVRVYP